MSPEQARGQQVDKRSDIWSYGCVLYEMLTGRCAFSGETASDTIAAILTAIAELGPVAGIDISRAPPPARTMFGKGSDAAAEGHWRGSCRTGRHRASRRPAPHRPAPPADRRLSRRTERVSRRCRRERQADLDYLSDGIAEALTYRLTAIQGLRVAPWAMVLRIRAKASGLRDHGQRIGGPDVVDRAAHDPRGHLSHPCRMVRSDRDDALVGRSIFQTHR